MIKNWLDFQDRVPCPYQFMVVDCIEADELSPELRQFLLDQLVRSRIAPEYVEELAKVVGWARVAEQIAMRFSSQISVRRGDFGEALMNTVMEEHHKYEIPVFKLRFKPTAHQTLTGTDVLALKRDPQGAIVEVCYVESKLRTNANSIVAVDAAKQLKADYESRLPEILDFIAERLWNTRQEVFHAFAIYMRDRRDTTDLDTFCIGLWWEQSVWNENLLSNLNEAEINLPRLTVHAIQISDLGPLTDSLFQELGVAGIVDDD